MKVNPYLNFDGNAKEAMEFYKSIFGGQFNSVMYFKDVPPGENPMPESEKNRIMHISLPLGRDIFLMASDISPAMGHKLSHGNNAYISLTPDSLKEAKRIYKELSKGAKKIEIELQKMFWGDYFAGFTDKFGVLWMINYKAKKGEEK